MSSSLLRDEILNLAVVDIRLEDGTENDSPENKTLLRCRVCGALIDASDSEALYEHLEHNTGSNLD